MPALRDRERAVGLPADQTGVELETHQEHEQHDSHLGNHAEVRRRARRQYVRRDVRCDSSQQRWAEQNSGDHLAHHGRLPHIMEQRAEAARADDHDHHRQEHVRQSLGRPPRRRGELLCELPCRRRGRGRGEAEAKLADQKVEADRGGDRL